MENRRPGKYAKIFAKILASKLDGRPGSWLARASGVSQSKISRLLDAKGDIDLTDASKLAQALGISTPDLLKQVFSGFKDEIDDDVIDSKRKRYAENTQAKINNDEKNAFERNSRVSRHLPTDKAIPPTVGEMTPDQLETLVARASKRDGAVNLEIARLKSLVESVHKDVLEFWSGAEDEIQSICLYLLTGKAEHLDAVPPAMLKRLNQLGALKTPPKSRSARSKE